MVLVAGAGAEQREAKALVVDAFGAAAAVVLVHLEYLAPEFSHPRRDAGDVVHPEIDLELGIALALAPIVNPRRRGDRFDVEAGAALVQLPAEEFAEEPGRARTVGNFEGHVPDVAEATAGRVFDRNVVGFDLRVDER